MSKYILFRVGNKMNRQFQTHELVAVERGRDIYDIEKRLIQAIREDIMGADDYDGSPIAVYPPERENKSSRSDRYDYEMRGIVRASARNLTVFYGIVEEKFFDEKKET